MIPTTNFGRKTLTSALDPIHEVNDQTIGEIYIKCQPDLRPNKKGPSTLDNVYPAAAQMDTILTDTSTENTKSPTDDPLHRLTHLFNPKILLHGYQERLDHATQVFEKIRKIVLS